MINLVAGVIVPAMFVTFPLLTTTAILDLIVLAVMTAVCTTLLAACEGLRRPGAVCLVALFTCFVVIQLASG